MIGIEAYEGRSQLWAEYVERQRERGALRAACAVCWPAGVEVCRD